MPLLHRKPLAHWGFGRVLGEFRPVSAAAARRPPAQSSVITSYSIHYTKLYEALETVATRAAALDLAGMTERLARYVAAYAETGAGDPTTLGAGLD